jgi:hypothetical protein
MQEAKTGTTKYKQVFSHIKNNNSQKNEQTHKAHLRKITIMYELDRTTKLINGNTEADVMTDIGNYNSSIFIPPIII